MRHYFFSHLFALLILIGVSSQQVLAQPKTGSNTKPLPQSSGRLYVFLPANGAVVTHVRTQRLRGKRLEFLDLINIIPPASFVQQQLISNGDIGPTGLYSTDELLITMTILPDPESGHLQWIPIQRNTITNTQQVTWSVVVGDCYTRLFNYKASRETEIDWSRRRLDLYPVIKQGNHYVTLKQQVLTEYFVLRNTPTWYPTSGDNATINCLARPYSPTDYLREQEAADAASLPGQPTIILRRELSTKLLLQKVQGNVYTFWSFPPPSTTGVDGILTASGVGDLRFQPKVGLISGRYTSYFGTISKEEDRFFDLIDTSIISSK